MRKPTSFHRYALLVLVVCLAAATGCGRTPTDQLDLTTLLPGEPAWLISSDIPALRDSETWRELQGIWLGQSGALAEMELFLEAAGIDPDNDLGKLLGGLYPNGAPIGEFTAVLTGRFNRDKLLPELEKRGFSAEIHREFTLVNPPPPESVAPGSPSHYRWHMVYLDDTAIGLADTRKGAVGLIDRRLEGGESLDRHAGFGPLLAHLDRTAPLWGAGLLAEDATAGLAAELPVQGIIPDLDNFAFSTRVVPDFQLTCVTLLPSDEEASKLAGQLNGWIKLGAGLIQANPQWFDGANSNDGTLRLVAETLDQVVVSAGGPAVSLVAAIPTELIMQAARATSPGSTDPPRQESTPVHP